MNSYLRWPIISDAALSTVISLLLLNWIFECPRDSDKSNFLNVISSLISTCVSLAGFILAALTIIITFKSNLKAKGIAEADDALELILSSKHYESIVTVFKGAIIEFILITVLLYFVSTTSSDITAYMLLLFTVNGIIITSLTILRSLVILFSILKLEKSNINKKRS